MPFAFPVETTSANRGKIDILKWLIIKQLIVLPISANKTQATIHQAICGNPFAN